MKRTTAFSLMALGSGFLFFFAIFEIALRLINYHGMDFDIEMWKYATQLKQVAENPAIGHEHIPGKNAFLMGAEVAINSKKLRNPEVEYKKPEETTRILMLGDSLTFGWGVAESDTPTRILERLLNQNPAKRAFQVINTGVGNYNTEMEVTYFLEEGYRFEPDAVVLNYFINDAEPTPRRQTNFLLEWSYVYVFLKGRLDIAARQRGEGQDWEKYYLSLYDENAVGWKAAISSINKLAEYLKDRHIPLFVVHYPELHDLKNYRFDGVREQLQRLSQKIGAEFIDLTDSVRGETETELWVSPSDAHPNAKANTAFARVIRERFLKYWNLNN